MQEMGGPHPASHYEAEIAHIVRTLRSYGVLTATRLCELAGGERWTGHTFHAALTAAVRSGRVKRLGDELYELADVDA